MCFVISKESAAVDTFRRKRIVWKVLRLTVKRRQLWGPYYPRLYKLGVVKERDAGPPSYYDTWSGDSKAKHGIYVHSSLSLARADAKRRALGSRAKWVVVCCQVRPEDLLHVSTPQAVWSVSVKGYVSGYHATYQRIKPLRIVK